MPALERAEPPFPFLFGGAFIEAFMWKQRPGLEAPFPFLFGGAFIEASPQTLAATLPISLPFRRGFH